MLRAAALLAGLGLAHPHGALISPMPRNAVDRFLPAYKGGRFGNSSCKHVASAPPKELPRDQYGPPDGEGSCWGCNCVNGTEPCEVAQTCVWFTEGTSIGCAKPGGDSPSPAPHCTPAQGLKNATNNDPYYRTMNLDVPALSAKDTFRWNPWRVSTRNTRRSPNRPTPRYPAPDPCSGWGGGSSPELTEVKLPANIPPCSVF